MRIASFRPIVCMFLVLASMTLLVAKGTQEGPRQPVRPGLDASKHFVIALEQSEDPISYHPHMASDADSLLVLSGLYEGLFSHDPVTAEPILAMASSVKTSADNLTWTIKLRDSLAFSNGDPIIAQTFVDSWLWLLSLSRQGNVASMASLLDAVVGANDYRLKQGDAKGVGFTAVGRDTLIITLQTPAPYLPGVLALPAFAPIHPSERNIANSNHIIDKIVPGPYRLAPSEQDNILLEKNPWYYDYESVASDYITFIRNQDAQKRADSYAQGNIDWSTAYIPLQAVTDRRDLRLAAQYASAFFYFSAADGPYAEPLVRQALASLIPWRDLRAESGQLFLTDRLVPFDEQQESGQPAALNESAYALLERAGYPRGAGLPVLTMAIHRGTQIEQTAHRIADIWSEALGLTVVLDVVPLGVYSHDPSQSPYDFAFITWIGDFMDPFAFLHLWSGDSSYNLGNLVDPVFDSLVRQAMSASDENTHLQLYREAERRLLDSAAVIPMHHGISSNYVATERVSGWYANLLDIHPLKNLGASR